MFIEILEKMISGPETMISGLDVLVRILAKCIFVQEVRGENSSKIHDFLIKRPTKILKNQR